MNAVKMLAVIDMQNDFIDGSLGTAEAVGIVGKVGETINKMRRCGAAVVFTRDTHGADYLCTGEGKRLPVEHCIQGTRGWEISPELDTENSEIIDKPTFGSFKLADYAASIPYLDEIVIVGLCTDICIISNAMILKAKLPEVKITVIADCCAGVTPESHRNALEAMKMCQIDVDTNL